MSWGCPPCGLLSLCNLRMSPQQNPHNHSRAPELRAGRLGRPSLPRLRTSSALTLASRHRRHLPGPWRMNVPHFRKSRRLWTCRDCTGVRCLQHRSRCVWHIARAQPSRLLTIAFALGLALLAEQLLHTRIATVSDHLWTACSTVVGLNQSTMMIGRFMIMIIIIIVIMIIGSHPLVVCIGRVVPS